jgi:anti-sigma factor RsiW
MNPEARRWPYVASAAAAVLAVFFVTRILSPIPPGGASDPLAHEILDSHLRSLFPGHLSDVQSQDPNTVRSWFNGKLDYSPPVANFAERGFSLEGGRLDVLAGRTVAAFVYRHNQHAINLFVWPAPGSQETGSASAARQGYNLLRWNHAGMNWWLASDLSQSEMESFARMLRTHEP